VCKCKIEGRVAGGVQVQTDEDEEEEKDEEL
jgi:hypothetical protein